MNKTEFFEDLQQKIADLLAHSPAADVQKNIRSLLMQGLAKLDLVTREEFDVQREVLARTRAKLSELESRLDALDQRCH